MPVTETIADDFIRNPSAIQKYSLELIRNRLGDDALPLDGHTPFAMALEHSALHTSLSVESFERNVRTLYPSLALDNQDLYTHMTDLDYINTFAVPSKAQIQMWIALDELKAKMVRSTTENLSKVIIPRNTTFTLNGVVFMIHYPIEIRHYNQGGIQAVWDNTIKSNVCDLTSNILPTIIRHVGGIEWLRVTIDVTQSDIISIERNLTRLTPGEVRIDLQGQQFYYADVYRQLPNLNPNTQDAPPVWQRIATTHSDLVFDPTKPTALLTNYGSYLEVKIPLVYITRGLIEHGLKVNVYVTQGALDMNLASYASDAFQVTFKSNIESENKNPFNFPNQHFVNYRIQSDSIVYGGRDDLDFLSLRNRIINHTIGANSIPITNIQIQDSLADYGYQIVKNIDFITNRQFLAVKGFPKPKNPDLVTAANATVRTLVTDIEKLEFNGNALFRYTTVDNAPVTNRVTITPKTLFVEEDGVLNEVHRTVKNKMLVDLKIMNIRTADTTRAVINTGKYYYTPFYYVIDVRGTFYNVRPYYFDSPKIEYKHYHGMNTGLDATVSIATASLSLDLIGTSREFSEGVDVYRYTLTLMVIGNETFIEMENEELFCQLAFLPQGSRTGLVYKDATSIEKPRPNQMPKYIDESGRESNIPDARIITFEIETKFDVTPSHGLGLHGFSMYSNDTRVHQVDLESDLHVIIGQRKVPVSYKTNQLDNLTGKHLLNSISGTLLHESLRINFGSYLGSLYRRIRSIVTPLSYKRYNSHVLREHEVDVLAYNSNGGPKYTIESGGNVVLEYKHRKGEPYLDEHGNQIIEHRLGEVVYDSDGEPELEEDGRKLVREIDIFLIEGHYYFADEPTTLDYMKDSLKILETWIVKELGQTYNCLDTEEGVINGRLLDKTHIYYYPKSTIGKIEVVVNENQKILIDAEQKFEVSIVVRDSIFKNSSLIDNLKIETTKTLEQLLDDKVISMAAIIATLKDLYGDNVIDVRITGLGGTDDYQMLTVVNDNERLGLKKRLVLLTDRSIRVEEDIDYKIINHG